MTSERWPFAIPAKLQPITLEEYERELPLSWRPAGIWECEVERAFKVRCSSGSCRGWAGYVVDVRQSPVAGVPEHILASTDDPWERRPEFRARRGWVLRESGLWELSRQAQKRTEARRPVVARRANPLFKGLSSTEIAKDMREEVYASDSYLARPGPRTMIAFDGSYDDDSVRDRLLKFASFPHFARCPDCKVPRILCIEPPTDSTLAG
jgi:hypothetical protein